MAIIGAEYCPRVGYICTKMFISYKTERRLIMTPLNILISNKSENNPETFDSQTFRGAQHRFFPIRKYIRDVFFVGVCRNIRPVPCLVDLDHGFTRGIHIHGRCLAKGGKRDCPGARIIGVERLDLHCYEWASVFNSSLVCLKRGPEGSESRYYGYHGACQSHPEHCFIVMLRRSMPQRLFDVSGAWSLFRSGR
jgi:hypothetical protein